MRIPLLSNYAHDRSRAERIARLLAPVMLETLLHHERAIEVRERLCLGELGLPSREYAVRLNFSSLKSISSAWNLSAEDIVFMTATEFAPTLVKLCDREVRRAGGRLSKSSSKRKPRKKAASNEESSSSSSASAKNATDVVMEKEDERGSDSERRGSSDDDDSSEEDEGSDAEMDDAAVDDDGTEHDPEEENDAGSASLPVWNGDAGQKVTDGLETQHKTGGREQLAGLPKFLSDAVLESSGSARISSVSMTPISELKADEDGSLWIEMKLVYSIDAKRLMILTYAEEAAVMQHKGGK
eukprot:g168.t1